MCGMRMTWLIMKPNRSTVIQLPKTVSVDHHFTSSYNALGQWMYIVVRKFKFKSGALCIFGLGLKNQMNDISKKTIWLQMMYTKWRFKKSGSGIPENWDNFFLKYICSCEHFSVGCLYELGPYFRPKLGSFAAHCIS